MKQNAPTEAIKIEYPNLVQEEAKIQEEKKKMKPLPKFEKSESPQDAESRAQRAARLKEMRDKIIEAKKAQLDEELGSSIRQREAESPEDR